MAVENYYSGLGVLLPSYTPMYWLGLRSNRTSWPEFDWFQRTVPAPDMFHYEHWGMMGSSREPNNRAGNEYCGAADAEQAYDGAWGWNDYNCSVMMPYICRLDGGRLAALPRCAMHLPQLRVSRCLEVGGESMGAVHGW